MFNHSGQIRFWSLALMIGLSSGCSSLESADHTKLADEALQQAQSSWQYQQANASQASQLTDLVDIPQLDQLIRQALDNNPSLRQTALTLQQTYAQRQVASGERWPALSANFSGSKEEDSAKSFSADLTVSWELDLWHKLGDSVNAAEADIASSKASYQGARDALAANVVRSWLQLILQQQLIDIQQQLVDVLENNEELIMQRYRAGLEELEALDSARSSTSSARATLVSYHEQQAQYRRAMNVLLGQSSQQWAMPTDYQFPTVLQPLANLPEQDLGRRPDLQEAWYNVLSADYESRAAYKDLLPSISLSAALTDIAETPSEALFTSPAWSLLGQLSAPLFQGGQLKAQAEIADLAAEQSYWAFQETLLDAVTEVNDTLGQEVSLTRQQQHIEQALDSAKRSQANYEQKYRQGLVDILDLLSVQQQTFSLQAELQEIIYQRLANRVDLGLALGLGVSQ